MSQDAAEHDDDDALPQPHHRAPHNSNYRAYQFFAQTQPPPALPLNVSFPPADAIPPGFEYLAEGCYGKVFASHGGQILLKYFVQGQIDPDQPVVTDADIHRECALLQYLSMRIPDYVPGPIALMRQGRDGLPVLQMHNAGNAMAMFEPAEQAILFPHALTARLLPLTVRELALCMLQSIHATLLLGSNVEMEDVNAFNVCVRWRGPNIQLRFIDVGMWSQTHESDSGVSSNASELFWNGPTCLWRWLLTKCAERNTKQGCAVDCRLAKHLRKMLRSIEMVSKCGAPVAADQIARPLLVAMSGIVLACMRSHATDAYVAGTCGDAPAAAYMPEVHALVTRIEHAATDASDGRSSCKNGQN